MWLMVTPKLSTLCSQKDRRSYNSTAAYRNVSRLQILPWRALYTCSS